MRPTRRTLLYGASALLLLLLAALAFVTRHEALQLITNPRATRKVPHTTPAADGVPYAEAAVTTSDGLRLVGWQIPSENGAAVMLVHGYKEDRAQLLGVAAMLHRHGYGALLLALRAHDLSDGERITFGQDEMRDMRAWFAYEAAQPGVRPDEIGLFGSSMGGSIAIQYAAANPRIRAVVADSAFSSLPDTVDTSVKFFTGLPPFPFAPLILDWTRHLTGFDPAAIDATRWIGRIGPRPVYLLQGGADVVISRGQRREALRGGTSAEDALVRARRRPHGLLQGPARRIRAPHRRLLRSVPVERAGTAPGDKVRRDIRWPLIEVNMARAARRTARLHAGG